jgi:hypothetical protein
MNLLKKISKRLFDLFFMVEEEAPTAEVLKEPSVPAAEEEEPAKEPVEGPPAETKPAAPEPVKTDADLAILRILFDAAFGGAITFGETVTEKHVVTAQDRKREEAEYLAFKKEMLGRSPKSAGATVKAFADGIHRELVSLDRDGERVKKHGLSRAVICKSRGRYRARYEKVSSYEMRGSDNLETLHIVDGEGRCYNNLGRAYATLKAMAQKMEFLKRFLNETYNVNPPNRDLVNIVMEAKNELAKEKQIKTGGR